MVPASGQVTPRHHANDSTHHQRTPVNLLDLNLRRLLYKLSLSELPLDRYRLSRYAEMVRRCKERSPHSILEIGTWRGDRSVEMLAASPGCTRYVGFDLFEGMDQQTFEKERMGACFPSTRQAVEQRLTAVRPTISVELVAGNTLETLPRFTRDADSFDFVYLDGGHSLETIASDWAAVRRVMDHDTVVIFDDYYLNDSSCGCKPLIDSLNPAEYRRHFFRTIEEIPAELAGSADPLFVTMVEVSFR